MNEADEWKRLSDEWTAAPQLPGSSVDLGAARVRERRKALMIWSAFVADFLIAIYATVTSLSHRSAIGYTFAIIAWSIVIPIAAYFLAGATGKEDLADTATYLTGRVRRVRRRAQLMEFSRVLVGVEILISAGFWIAIRHSQGRSILEGALTITAFGAALYLGLSRVATSAKWEQRALESMSATLLNS